MSIADRGIHKEDWAVQPISMLTATLLVQRLHYAKSGSNTATYLHGLFRKGADFLEADCLGVAWWLPPTKAAAISVYPEGDWKKVLSLSRLCLDPSVPVNGCSFMLSRSMNMIDPEKWECLVTYADTWRGHSGSIYRATNWQYMGMTKPQAVFTHERSGRMMGRKRGPVTLKTAEIEQQGFVKQGTYAKHRYRKLLKRKKKRVNKISIHTE